MLLWLYLQISSKFPKQIAPTAASLDSTDNVKRTYDSCNIPRVSHQDVERLFVKPHTRLQVRPSHFSATCSSRHFVPLKEPPFTQRLRNASLFMCA